MSHGSTDNVPGLCEQGCKPLSTHTPGPRVRRSQVTCVVKKPELPYEFDGRANPTVREKYINGNELAIWIQGRTTHAAYRKFEGLWVTRSDIEKLFVAPIEQASKMLGVAKSTMKKLCRRFGINVWRHGSESCKLTPWRNPEERRDYLAVRRSEASDLKYLKKRSSLYRVACDVRRTSDRLRERVHTKKVKKKNEKETCILTSQGGTDGPSYFEGDVLPSSVECPIDGPALGDLSQDCDIGGIVPVHEDEQGPGHVQCNQEEIDNLWVDLCGGTSGAVEQRPNKTEDVLHVENDASLETTLQDIPLSLTALPHGTKVQLEHATISVSKWRRSVQRMQYMKPLMVFGSGRVDVIP